jgi:uncharacterized membrane protein
MWQRAKLPPQTIHFRRLLGNANAAEPAVRKIVNHGQWMTPIFANTGERQINPKAMTTILAERYTGTGAADIAAVERAKTVSNWRHRIPIIALAACGFCIAGYLGAYQIHLLSSVWDPVFGSGSERVLHSFISRLLPIPDAVLGALGYAAETLFAAVGGRVRWCTNSRLVCVYGAIVLCLAIIAIVLTAVQIFIVRAGCTLCLASAGLSLIIAALAGPEVIAAARNLYHHIEL